MLAAKRSSFSPDKYGGPVSTTKSESAGFYEWQTAFAQAIFEQKWHE